MECTAKGTCRFAVSAYNVLHRMILDVDGDGIRERLNGDTMMEESDFKGMPKVPGVYKAEIEYYFQQGFFEGYPADGESEWEFRLKNVVQVLSLASA